MAVIDRLLQLQPAMMKWRRELHAHPELAYDVRRTAAFVAARLREFGCDDIVTGIGRTGVVGVIKGRRLVKQVSRAIGLRADMDALPIHETTNLPYRSTTPGSMHACGHDGHMAMLLGAARYLAATRDFEGTVVVIFQPAEESGAGAAAMLGDGLMERFGIAQVFGLHNMPSMEIGSFAIRSGPLMASTDLITIQIEGKGGHAARPHLCRDAVLAGAHLVVALQSIVSRNIDPLEAGVVSICGFQAPSAHNIMPERLELKGTARALVPEIRDLIECRVREIAAGIATSSAVTIDVQYERGYPVLVNHAEEMDIASEAAAAVAGHAKVNRGCAPVMIAEDFAYMLQARPGAFIFMGNGDSEGLHQSGYDFDDEAAIYGASYWVKLVECVLGSGV